MWRDEFIEGLLTLGWFTKHSVESSLTEDMYPPAIEHTKELTQIIFTNKEMTVTFSLQFSWEVVIDIRVNTRAIIGTWEAGMLDFDSTRRVELLDLPDLNRVRYELQCREWQKIEDERVKALAAITELADADTIDDVEAAIQLINEYVGSLRNYGTAYEVNKRFQNAAKNTIEALETKKYDLGLEAYAEDVRQFASEVESAQADDLAIWQTLLTRAEELKSGFYEAYFYFDAPYKKAYELWLRCLTTVTQLKR
jgi:hypothetical protein